MSIKSILVVVSGRSGDDSRVKEGFALAKAHRSAVAALHVMPSPELYISSPELGIPVSVIEAQQKRIDETARATEVEVKTAAERAGIALEWRCEEGDEVAVAAVHARYSDLVIASPELARDLVFVSGVPVLAFADGLTPSVPKRVLIAWNGSREAARAVREAMPLLESAEAVDVVVVDPPGARPIGVDLARMLAHHGITIEVRERLSGDAEVGTVLLEEAKTSGADLLVMGAYGHSRFREWILGGATEEALSNRAIPILLAH